VLTDPGESFVVSSLGWVDGGALWILDVASARSRLAPLSEARHLTLHGGKAGHFAVVHHYDDERLAITAHSFDDPAAILSQAIIAGESTSLEGPLSPWAHLPRHYIAHLVQRARVGYALVSIDEAQGLVLQKFEWYEHAYDKGYQGIVGVAEVPDSRLLLISVQRSSKVVVYDPHTSRQVATFALCGRQGNPTLQFRSRARELWAVDYDTIVKVTPDSWGVVKSRRLQGASRGTAQFIGSFSFDAHETLCAVARPFSGDIVALDPKTLRTRYRAKVGGQPLEVAVLGGHRVFARDWKTGSLLTGRLRRAWFG
jgi:hypothetical protein